VAPQAHQEPFAAVPGRIRTASHGARPAERNPQFPAISGLKSFAGLIFWNTTKKDLISPNRSGA
jgi:hypothetical protein